MDRNNGATLEADRVNIADEAEQYVSIGDYAKTKGVSRSLVYAMVKSGEIPSVALRKRLLIPVRIADEWLRRQIRLPGST